MWRGRIPLTAAQGGWGQAALTGELSVSSEPSVRIERLTKAYAGGRGVFDLSLSVPQRSITGFIGANGAGKSTTLRCIMGILEPDAGTVELFGAPAGPASRRLIGFIPEERGLDPRERARDAIAFHARLR